MLSSIKKRKSSTIKLKNTTMLKFLFFYLEEKTITQRKKRKKTRQFEFAKTQFKNVKVHKPTCLELAVHCSKKHPVM